MNNVTLIGRLTKDPYVTDVNGEKHALFTLAVNDFQKSQFLNCDAWGRTAETTAQFIRKGSKVGVTGYLVGGSYESKKDGTVKYSMIVRANHVEFLDSKKEGIMQDAEKITRADDRGTTAIDVTEGFKEVNDDIPF